MYLGMNSVRPRSGSGAEGLGHGFEAYESGRLDDLHSPEDRLLGWGGLGALEHFSAGPGGASQMHLFQLAAQIAPAVVGLVLGQSDQEQACWRSGKVQ